MAYDAGILSLVVSELNAAELSKVEKIYQPGNDEITISFRAGARDTVRLLINAGANQPRLHLTAETQENPTVAPMFCMLLRKHLLGAKLACVRQIGYERVCELEFDAYDELGFLSKKYLIVEIMGKCSNLILADASHRIVAPLRAVDFSTSQKRQLLPGMTYTLPPKQDKEDPRGVTPERFETLYGDAKSEIFCYQFIMNSFLGIAPSVARQIVYDAFGDFERRVGDGSAKILYASFADTMEKIVSGRAEPCLVTDEKGTPVEYAYLPLTQYGDAFSRSRAESFNALIDGFTRKKAHEERIRHRASDIAHLLSTAHARVARKLEAQRGELAECDKGETYRRYADLITGSIYAIRRGDAEAVLTDYYDEAMPTVTVPLDPRLTPSQNAQNYYKRYNKMKKRRSELTKQLALGEEELDYLATVQSALDLAETEADLVEIRDELAKSGYASRMKATAQKKQTAPAYMKFRTSGGYLVLCGKNNKQNDYVTTRVADKNDWWFHVKNQPGSHAVLVANGEEPGERDFTEAAEIAAYYSKGRDGEHVAVDYVRARYVKKPAGAKPGFVVYETNYTAFVTPDEARVLAMKIK